MQQHRIMGLLACVLGSSLLASPLVAEERYVTIGTGGQTGVYYTAGQSICRFLNRSGAEHGIKCNAPSSAGSVSNIASIKGGDYDFGFIQSDHQNKALTGQAPSVDFALVALRRHLQLPPGSAFGLFALGRCAGWLAQALEQRATRQIIRPRAAYTGPRPARFGTELSTMR